MHRALRYGILIAVAVLVLPAPAHAYIGPGAGFTIAGSFLAVFLAVASAVLMLLLWPFRYLLRKLTQKRVPHPPQAKRVVVLGLDGLDYRVTSELLARGELPNLARLQSQGCFRPLGSTLPPISPVAWSTFQTGVNPGKHNIYDFITPDTQTYRPKLSSVEIQSTKRTWKLGPWSWTFTRPVVRLLRKSQPFWSILSEYGVFSAILRVPITFPPEKLRGVQLSAMCVPDLRGTQGTFSHYTSRPQTEGEPAKDYRYHVTLQNGVVESVLVGPEHPKDSTAAPLQIPFTLRLQDSGRAQLEIDGQTIELTVGEYTAWTSLRFRWGLWSSVRGICRFLLLSTDPHVEFYITPINIDPEQPVLPIGYPQLYPNYLAKRQGPYATLGLAEDTTGLSEQVLHDQVFLQQCLDTDRERETMFFDGLSKVTDGLLVCVFDGTDRMQHMFWRYHDPEHPARPETLLPSQEDVIEDLYRRMDDLVGRTLARCEQPDTVLMVLSDHGFNTFRRGVDLNSWLEQAGYLVVDDSWRGDEYLAGIDWSRTRAFCIGLTGIFINRKDRFSQGIVEPGEESEQLVDELASKLGSLTDPVQHQRAIRRVYRASKAYRGAYKDNAPDLIIGYEEGYRVSWDSANGKTARAVFSDNTKAWSGDHCVDPSVVPGVLFCNRLIPEEQPRLIDMAPTILTLLGAPVPEYMDGRALAVGTTPHPVAPPELRVMQEVT
ncbi:nucleotide pyrophosphatase [bacterium]|nr:nucleotide pyrophosphatase [bacterium]